MPHFCARHFCERLQIACTEALAVELKNVSGLWDLNEQSRRVALSSGLCLES